MSQNKNKKPLTTKEEQKQEYQPVAVRSQSMDSDNIDQSSKRNQQAFSPAQNQQNLQNSFLFSESNAAEEHIELHKNSQLCIESPVVVNKYEQPSYQCIVTLSVSSQQISKEFLKIAQKLGYIAIENEKNSLLVIQKNRVTLKTYLLSCVFNQQQDSDLTAVKLNIVTNNNKCIRKVILKGLHGDQKLNTQLVEEFKHQIEKKRQENTNQMQRPQTEETKGDSTNFDLAFNAPQQIDSDEENEHNNNPFTLESTANYMFYKILSATQYGIGKKAHEYLIEFQQKYGDPEEAKTQIPKPIKEVVNLINELVDNLFSEHNYGKSETKTIMPYCKISVEKYIFQKVSSSLMKLYNAKFKEQEEKFQNKKNEILKLMSIKQFLNELDLGPKFWLLEGISEKKNEKNKVDYDDQDLRAEDEINSESKPYNNAITELRKIHTCENPREKLKCAMMMRSMMRAGVIDFHSGKEELLSMDDELPVIMYIILMCDVKELYSELAIVEDFINNDPSLEGEKRLLLNLSQSAKYIADYFNISESIRNKEEKKE